MFTMQKKKVRGSFYKQTAGILINQNHSASENKGGTHSNKITGFDILETQRFIHYKPCHAWR